MAQILNTDVFALESSIYRSGYPMMSHAPDEQEFKQSVEEISRCISNGDFSNHHIKRAIRLANSRGGGHDQFLTGIVVNFDLTISNKAWVEVERYTFLNFISSMSSMHRASAFCIQDSCNEYVCREEIEMAERLQNIYNDIDEEKFPMEKKHAYLKLLYNLPSGFEITAGMTTNYRCLKNIYSQRHNHRLQDWKIICKWIHSLPLAEYLILGANQN